MRRVQEARIDLRDALLHLDDDGLKELFLRGDGDGGSESAEVRIRAPKHHRQWHTYRLIRNIRAVVEGTADAVDLVAREREVWQGVDGDLSDAKADLLRKYFVPAGPRSVSAELKGPGSPVTPRKAGAPDGGVEAPTTPEQVVGGPQGAVADMVRVYLPRRMAKTLRSVRCCSSASCSCCADVSVQYTMLHCPFAGTAALRRVHFVQHACQIMHASGRM